MNRAFTNREKVLLVILAVLLIVIGYFKLILEPINNNIETYQADAAAEQDEILQNTVILTRMKQMQHELEEIYAADDAKPLPDFDNSEKLLVELNRILSASDDYSLSFSQVRRLDGDYIVCRPVSLSFHTDTYQAARALIDALAASDAINQISDLSMTMSDGSDGVRVSLTITYFELDR